MYRPVVVVGLLGALAACGGGHDRVASKRDAPGLASVAATPARPTAPSAPPPPHYPTVATASAAPCPAPAQVVTDGAAAGWICPDAAAAHGLTVIDLTDGWTPRVFAPGADGRAPTFRARYLALAAERSLGGDELDPEEQYVELYGVMPNLAVIQRRLTDDARHACHDAIDPAPLGAFKRSLSQANDAGIRAADQRRKIFKVLIERELKKRALAGLDALAAVPAWKARVAQYRQLDAQHAALMTLQAHLLCEDVLEPRYHDGLYTWRTGYAVDLYQRKNFLVPNARFDDETRLSLLAGSRELAFRAALRVLREHVTDATGLIEDGTAGAGPTPVLGRQLEPAAMRGARGYPPLADAAPDLIDAATQIAATQLGWTDPDHVRTWLARTDAAHRRVALALPPPPAYHAAHMELAAEIDRGDVWYDAQPTPHIAQRRPALTLFVVDGGVRRPLVRWPTTIGGWAEQRLKNGRVVKKWKESDVGPRVWRDLYAAPVWYPPNTTPDKDLVRFLWPGWRLKTEVFGPGPRSAYGMVMLVHHRPTPIGKHKLRFDDNGIRSHGSASVTSIAYGTSHGCHRLYNHLAVRLGGFLLAHRNHTVRGQDRAPFKRTVRYHGHQFEAKLFTHGFIYQLTPPVPVEVLPGRIRSKRKIPPAGSAPAAP